MVKELGKDKCLKALTLLLENLGSIPSIYMAAQKKKMFCSTEETVKRQLAEWWEGDFTGYSPNRQLRYHICKEL